MAGYVTDSTLPLGPFLLTLASLGGVAILFEMTRREFAMHTFTMLLGMIAWFGGNLLWMLGWQIFQVVFFWQAFLILTIAGERLELSRVLAPIKTSTDIIWHNYCCLSRGHYRFHFQYTDRLALERRGFAFSGALVCAK